LDGEGYAPPEFGDGQKGQQGGPEECVRGVH
jgi:hypothetical protein